MTNLRLAIYALGLLAGVAAAWAASVGLGSYDPATGVFHPHPFHVETVVATLVTAAGNFLAAVAVWRGWGRK